MPVSTERILVGATRMFEILEALMLLVSTEVVVRFEPEIGVMTEDDRESCRTDFTCCCCCCCCCDLRRSLGDCAEGLVVVTDPAVDIYADAVYANDVDVVELGIF